ncbi:HAD-IA family hydrolase [Micromonospora chersina]|uniref:Haloacid dehalogenase superfamily, subfamily IA, variant 3 with third motif having DD or ED/haloacid dehalogenase superfamily, subfamily IA, variant 1 with third motif having Dx(3-4)D or Dx(3-4)E n=1 Tax=Micromonospora chersina TaxID=47854 RepID=A0A1C6UAD2_9ACTN|nr:HAD-IA family hydrolase [Micromonospora chersina]SCL50992.1 haloacid dehalogenase superfamily, subfamily IA, variant 3 with third motif having DD or ED/haloacid dehalogenase superfamily, subfamily IA, variant 1 with third motif having Dx(3-4)D or Dx(3-4)E [Micromonospora chersina]
MALAPLPEEDHFCESCALRYGDLTPSAALGLIRSHPGRYRRRLQHLPADVVRRRPASGVWSALEYAGHVRDVYDVYDTRVRRTLTEHEPTLEPMRNDERAEQGAYNQQPLAAVLLDLDRNADRFAALASEISEPQWSRTAVRLSGEHRTVLWMVRQAAHEGLHHLHDIGAGANDKAVLFDVDGVLVDSYPAYRRIWSRWADHRNLDPDLVWSHTHGRRPVDTIQAVAPQLDAAAEYSLIREFMANEGDVFPVYADAAAVLRLLQDRRWGVVTSGRTPTVLQRLRAGGLPDPPVLVDSSQVRRGKPDPEGYLRAAQLLDVPASDCLVIEDAPAGVQAARTAGMTVVAVRTTHLDDELAGAHHRVDTLSDTVPLITGWLEGRTREPGNRTTR